MKPIRRLAIGLLYFNKNLPSFERALEYAKAELQKSQLVEEVAYIVRQGMSVDMARDYIAHEVVEQDYDAIVWIDTDLVFPPHTFVNFVNASNAGYPVVCGLYRRAKHPSHLLVKREGSEWAELDELRAHMDGGVTYVKLAAGGFSIVKADVYKTLRAANPNLPMYCNWDFPHSGGWCGEDTYFMRRLSDAQIPVVVDPDLHAVHWSQWGPVPVLDDAPEMEWCQ